MVIAVETLGKLERRMTITLPKAEVQAELEKRLKARVRTEMVLGFRSVKGPLKMIAAQYVAQIEQDILNQIVGDAFANAAAENNLPVAGFPKMELKSENTVDATLLFDVMF